jgi:site-specific recombinase XerD
MDSHVTDFLKFCRIKSQDETKLTEYRLALNEYFYFSGNVINTEVIISYFERLRGEYEDSVSLKKITPLKAYCKFLKDKGALDENPFVNVEIPFKVEPKQVTATKSKLPVIIFIAIAVIAVGGIAAYTA